MAGRGTDILLGGNPEMIAKLEFREQGRDPDKEPEAFAELVEKYDKPLQGRGRRGARRSAACTSSGTERHESRRIDNQLRGRAGRQGDPGSSRFYLSLEDDLMRIFAGDRVKSLMERMGMPDNEPIVHPWVTKSIQDAQRKVEERNFDIRKHLLEYDDVMNEQRKTVYKLRQQLLLGIYKPEKLDEDGKPTGKMRDIKVDPRIAEEVKPAITDMVLHHGTPIGVEGKQPAEDGRGGRRDLLDDVAAAGRLPVLGLPLRLQGRRRQEAAARSTSGCSPEIPQSLTEQREQLARPPRQHRRRDRRGVLPGQQAARGLGLEGHQERVHRALRVEGAGGRAPARSRADRQGALRVRPRPSCNEKEKEMGTELLLRVFRHFYLEEIDRQWVDHLTNMEHLRDGIGLRGYGQRDPKQEYKKEGYDVFIDMMAATSSNVCTKLFKVQVRKETDIERIEREDAEKHAAQQRAMQTRHGSELAGGRRGGRSARCSSSAGGAPAAAGPGSAGASRWAEDRPQRSVPVRQRPKIQEVPRRGTRGRGRRRRNCVTICRG